MIKRSKIYTAMCILFALTACALAVFFVYEEIGFDLPDTIERWGGKYEGTFYVEGDDVLIAEDLTTPFDVGGYYGKVVLSTKLPYALQNDTVFCLLSGVDCRIYVDGILRYTFDSSDNPLPGDAVKVVVLQVPLEKSDGGKVLSIVRNGGGSAVTGIKRVYLGNSLGVYEAILKEFGWTFFPACMLLVVCLVTVGIGIIKKIFGKDLNHLFLLGCCFILPTVWIIFDNVLFQYLFGTYYIEGVLEYMLAVLLPIPFMLYLNRIQNRQYEALFTGLIIGDFATLITLSYAHFTGMANFSRTLPYLDLAVVVIIAATLVSVAWDIIDHSAGDYWIFILGIAGLGLGGIVDIIMMNMGLEWLDTLAVTIGLIFLFGCSIINAALTAARRQQQAYESLRQGQIKNEFFAKMSHEIRTPINAIMGMNEMILREDVSDEVKKYAENIGTASGYLLGIVNDILDYSKIEQGRDSLLELPYDTLDIITTIRTQINSHAGMNKLDVQLEVDEKLPCRLEGDLLKIKQTVANIVDNAFKYTDRGFVRITVLSQPLLGEPGKVMLAIQVADSGIGIKEKDLEHVFDEYVRVDEKGKLGTGLGMSIVKSFVDMMGGYLTVDSTYGVGSIFNVAIPQKVIDGRPIGPEIAQLQKMKANQPYKSRFTAPYASVMVVDDNDMNIIVARGLLNPCKMAIDAANSGEKFLEAVQKKHYDLIFLDHMMPGMDGIEAYKALDKLTKRGKNKCQNTPVIVMTANAAAGAREEYMEEGFDDYISKPVTAEALEDMCIKYLPANLVVMNEDDEVSDTVPQVNDQVSDRVFQAYDDVSEAVSQAKDKKLDTAPQDYGETRNGQNVEKREQDLSLNSNAPLVDKAAANQYTSGDEDMYQLLADTFLSEADAKIKALGDYLAAEDFKNYQVAIHGLKGTSKMIGALLLSQEALSLETACKEERYDFVRENHDKVMKLYQATLIELKEYI